MTEPLRSTGWSVAPGFTTHTATTDLTLLFDETGLTQLAGDPPVAWQTPWAELSDVEMVRSRRSLTLAATVGGVRYTWTNRSLADADRLGAVVVEHAGGVQRRRRRGVIVAVALLVLVASVTGGVGAWLNRSSTSVDELASVKAINLTQKDLPDAFAPLTNATVSPLSAIFPAGDQVITSTTKAPVTTTTTKSDQVFAQAAALFQDCLGVSARRDRVYGLAGQQPDYQVSSKIYSASSFGGIEVASTSQYYATSTMVRRDTREMSHPDFGSCFTTSNAAIVLSAFAKPQPTANIATNWRPLTFVRGWSRGGVTMVDLPYGIGALHLVMAVITRGHYEVTLGVLVNRWPRASLFASNLVNSMLARMTSASARAV